MYRKLQNRQHQVPLQFTTGVSGAQLTGLVFDNMVDGHLDQPGILLRMN
jgi:hypothetical protein